MKDEPIQKELRQLLARLPDAAVASNFTARVLQAVEREEMRAARRSIFNWNWHAWLPRIAVASAVVTFAGLTFNHYERVSQRKSLANGVALMVAETKMPDLEALKNFDAIRRMSQPARADNEMLALASALMK